MYSWWLSNSPVEINFTNGSVRNEQSCRSFQRLKRYATVLHRIWCALGKGLGRRNELDEILVEGKEKNSLKHAWNG